MDHGLNVATFVSLSIEGFLLRETTSRETNDAFVAYRCRYR
jgi:hypothetical protein